MSLCFGFFSENTLGDGLRKTRIRVRVDPCPWIFEIITKNAFWRKIQKYKWSLGCQWHHVTLRTRKQKLNVQIECQLSYLMMPILNSIWQYKMKYAVLNKNICHCLRPWPTGISERKAQENIILIEWPQVTASDFSTYYILKELQNEPSITQCLNPIIADSLLSLYEILTFRFLPFMTGYYVISSRCFEKVYFFQTNYECALFRFSPHISPSWFDFWKRGILVTDQHNQHNRFSKGGYFWWKSETPTYWVVTGP